MMPKDIRSRRYGDEKSTDDVYEDMTYPKPDELQKALSETSYFTEKEAFAFVQGHIEGLPRISREIGRTPSYLKQEGYKNRDEFDAIKEKAKEKVAEAIWIRELIDTYRHPPIPQECTECGASIQGGYYVEGTSEALCRDCVDIDPDVLEDQRLIDLK